MLGGSMVEPAVSLAEAQAFVRIENGEEEAILAGLIRSATGLCEAFINQALIAREQIEMIAASVEWQRLSVAPVRSIETVEAIGPDGTSAALPAGSYAIDIDASGDGWIRLVADVGATRLQVRSRVGMAIDANGVPEPIRHGVLRLVGHLFAARDGSLSEPPAAVTALWRPFRRMRLA